MDDPHIEELLRAHRPSGPPDYLRDRIIGGHMRVAPAWPWMFAAAALLVVSVGFHVSASRLRAMAADTPSVTATVTPEQREILRSIYGEAADVIVARVEAIAALEQRDAPASQPETPAWP
jgi:hypothetical protein